MPFNLLPSGPSQQQTDEGNARAIAAKINAGAPVSPTDVRWLYSKGYGGMVQSSPYTSNKASLYTSPYTNPYGMANTSFVQPPIPTPSPTPSPVTPTPQDFWTQQGYPEYRGAYAEPTVPTGWTVESVTRTSTGAPQIQLRLTNIEAALASGQTLPTEVMDAYNAKLKYDVDVTESKKKWTLLGYGKYGGQYTAPDVPSGFKISNITESDTGLNIQYQAYNAKGYMQLAKTMTTQQLDVLQAELIAPTRAQDIGQKMVSGGAVTAKEAIWLGKNFPDYASQVFEARKAGTRAGDVGAKIAGGGYVSAKDVLWLQGVFPDYAKQVGDVKMGAQRAGVIGQNYIAGGAFSAKEMVWLGKNYPEYGQNLFELSGEQASVARAELVGGKIASGGYVSAKEAIRLSREFPEYATQVGAVRSSTLASLKAAEISNAATKLSTDFYTGIGYPQFAGKYEPFKIPFGLVLSSLEETKPRELKPGEFGPKDVPRLKATFTSGSWTENMEKSHEPTVWENVGSWLSETVTIGGPPSFTIIQGKQTFPDYGVKLTRGEALTAIVALNLPFAAPAALPFLGLSSTGIIASAGVSVGVSEAVSLITTRKNITLGQAAQSALIGEALTIGSSAVLKGASMIPKIGPIFTRSIIESLTSSGLRGAATSVASRAAIFSAFGAGTGYALSGGDVKQAGIGAISGAAFSAGGDIFKYGVERGVIPIPKYGSVKVPFEIEGEEGVFYTKESTWRGLYLSRGEKASALVGKFSDFPESMGSVDDELAGVRARIASHGVSGEEPGWKPISNIESEVTLRTMSRMGYGPQVIEDFGIARQVMGVTQYTTSEFIEDMLPSKTGTLSKEGVSNLKDYILKSKSQVSEIFGRFGTNPQLSTEFEYTLTTPSGDVISALRPTSDIDIQLTTSNLEDASKFTSGALKVLGKAGDIVRISPEKPTLIEANIGGKWAHAVDIKYEGMPDTQLSAEGGWGFKYSRPTTVIEGLPAMSLSEQGLRKGANSFLGFTEDMGMGPVAHRLKDIPDFFQAQQTLLESARPSGKVTEAQSLLSGLAERYNVNLAGLPPMGESYLVSRSTVFQATPITVLPQIFAVSKTQISPLTVSTKAISLSLSSISAPSIAKLTAYPSMKTSVMKTSLPSLISPSVSSPKLVTNMASLMMASTPKKSVGASKIYSSMSKLVSPSSYASIGAYTSPKSVSSLFPLSSFSKSVSRVLSVSPITSSPSVSLPKMFSYPSSFSPSKTMSPKPSYPSYPSLNYPSVPYPSISPSPSPSPYSSISLTSISPPITKKPRLPLFETKKSKRRWGQGEWFKRTHPILEPKQVFSQFWGRPKLSVSRIGARGKRHKVSVTRVGSRKARRSKRKK